MQVLSSQKQITKCESTAFSGTRFPFDRYAGFHYSGFTVYFAPVYSNGTDAFGFTALPAGMNSPDGYFFLGQSVVFWSSTEKSFKEAGIMILRHEDGDLGILEYTEKFVPLSVRCVKD